jgi:hypothetical protein
MTTEELVPRQVMLRPKTLSAIKAIADLENRSVRQQIARALDQWVELYQQRTRSAA